MQYGLKNFVNSDAHREASLGCYGNDFEDDITTMDQLIDYLNGDNLVGSKIGRFKSIIILDFGG